MDFLDPGFAQGWRKPWVYSVCATCICPAFGWLSKVHRYVEDSDWNYNVTNTARDPVLTYFLLGRSQTLTRKPKEKWMNFNSVRLEPGLLPSYGT